MKKKQTKQSWLTQSPKITKLDAGAIQYWYAILLLLLLIYNKGFNDLHVLGYCITGGCIFYSTFQDNNLERAADWIFSHAGELDTPMETDQPEETKSKCRDGSGSKFFYVCHLRQALACGSRLPLIREKTGRIFFSRLGILRKDRHFFLQIETC